MVDSRFFLYSALLLLQYECWLVLLGCWGGGNKGAQKRRRKGSLAEGEDAPDLRALGPMPRCSSQLKKMLSPAKGKRGLAAHERK